MINVVSLLFFFVSSSLLCAQAQSFSWADCGVPGSRNIHYQSVTASSSPAQTQTNGSFSINVEATIVNMIYEADTQLQVWQGEALFLSVDIAPLCNIISTTNSLSCPIPVGHLSFTYTFEDIPDVPSGNYVVKIVSSVSGTELGCLQMSGGIQGAYSASSCMYQSYVNADLSATFTFQQPSAADRTVGSTFQIGSGSSNYATFSSYQSSPDLATSTSISNFAFSGSGFVTSHNTLTNGTTFEDYNGTFTIFYLQSGIYQPVYTGTFSWSGVTSPNSNPQWTVGGDLTLDPQYVDFYGTPLASVFSYPLTLGNLNPFTMQANGASFVLSGTREYCTCAYDDCNVCGGDNSSCDKGSSSHKRSAKEIAAICVGTIGGVLGLIAIIVLGRKAHRARSAPLLNDHDLIDHPDKPDYGTMAIDDAIREGERV